MDLTNSPGIGIGILCNKVMNDILSFTSLADQTVFKNDCRVAEVFKVRL